MWRLLLFVSLCVITVNSYKNNDNCDGCRNIEYTRVKRGKYFSNPPAKFYNRPPNSLSIKGPFSYTPPPGYGSNDIGPSPISHAIRPYKVSKRPINEGLGDEDINNIIKYLSKKDLNKLIELATESERYSVASREPTEKMNNQFPGRDSNHNINIYNDRHQDYKNSKYINALNVRPDEFELNNFEDNRNINYFTNSHQVPVNDNHNTNGQYTKEMLRQEEQLSFLDETIQKEMYKISPDKINVYSDSRTLQEEPLPRPSNLRNNYFETSFTNNIPKIVKPESSYELKNFADLPLMNYENSKLDTVNSYNVPHYSVTSFKQQGSKISFPSLPSSLKSPSQPSSLSQSQSSVTAPEVEPAPPASVTKEQSESHLKAIKIWTHRSKGTAYTLHDDGTLSLEMPTKPKIKFT